MTTYEVMDSPECVAPGCGRPIAVSDVDWDSYRQGRPMHKACALLDRVQAHDRHVAHLQAWRQAYGSSDEDGYCRHGMFVGGVGIDRMCGTCEGTDVDTEIADTVARAVWLRDHIPPAPMQRSDAVNTVLDGLGINPAPAQAAHTCASCKGPAETFDDTLSAREYSISGLCQTCQNDVFAPPVEHTDAHPYDGANDACAEPGCYGPD